MALLLMVQDGATGKAKGKGKGKGKSTKTGKGKRSNNRDPSYLVILTFGTAVRPNAVEMYTIQSFYEASNPYCVRKRTPTEPSMSPGQIVTLPDDTLVIPRLQPNQRLDFDTQLIYHQALKAIHQMNGSHIHYYVQEDNPSRDFVNLKGEIVPTSYQIPRHDQRRSGR